ncbi:MAG: phosphoribosyl-AMP cyclohydrolase [Opitutae bacterium]|nr:phosphoribosyl-AMP cyclohydrolase [Opitutae bacterium]MCD8298173.1 phosphoribosyl-AMP cyclohydrolase [Opitutae bacterium]
MSKEIEEGLKLNFDFKKLRKVMEKCESDVVPVVAQDADTKEVLIVAYANKLALDTTLKEGMATFWSTSRNELWIKGKTSGDFLKIVEIRVNCEQNSLLYLVRPAGKGACHTKHAATNLPRASCYYRRLDLQDGETLSFVPGAE